MAWLRPLWKLAQALSAQRENVRGKPENNSRVEYSFYLDGNPDDRTPRCGWCRASATRRWTAWWPST